MTSVYTVGEISNNIKIYTENNNIKIYTEQVGRWQVYILLER